MKSFILPKTILLALAALLLPLTLFAATETVNGIEWTYTVTDGKATITSGTEFSAAIPSSTSGPVTVPSTLGGYPVTAIGEYAFYNCSEVTSFTIPDGVTSLGKYAFCGCFKLMSFTFPDGVTSIEMAAFGSCAELTSITIPNLVTNIGNYAFYNCKELTSVAIPDNVAYIGDHAFESCSGLTTVTIPGGVTSIGTKAFYSSGLRSVRIGHCVTNIADYAFAACRKLTTVTIPDSMSSIGDSAFSGCWNLVAIFIPESLADQAGSWKLPSGCQIVEGIDVTVEEVCVPKEWIFRRAPPALDAANGDWATAARAVAANGVNKVWECYVAGLDPTNATDRFLATISLDEVGRPLVSWTPDLGIDRDYTLKGKASLADEWGEPDADSRFFRVLVALPPPGSDPVTRTDYVYWAPIPATPEGYADPTRVAPTVAQIKEMNKAEISDATLTAKIPIEFNAQTFWRFVAFPKSFADRVIWSTTANIDFVSAAISTPGEMIIDGVIYNTYQWTGDNISSAPETLVLKKN